MVYNYVYDAYEVIISYIATTFVPSILIAAVRIPLSSFSETVEELLSLSVATDPLM